MFLNYKLCYLHVPLNLPPENRVAGPPSSRLVGFAHGKTTTARVKPMKNIDGRVSECPPMRWEFDSDRALAEATLEYEEKNGKIGDFFD